MGRMALFRPGPCGELEQVARVVGTASFARACVKGEEVVGRVEVLVKDIVANARPVGGLLFFVARPDGEVGGSAEEGHGGGCARSAKLRCLLTSQDSLVDDAVYYSGECAQSADVYCNPLSPAAHAVRRRVLLLGQKGQWRI